MITLAQAKTILGDRGKRLSDEEIQKIISFLYRISDRAINTIICNNIASGSSKPYNYIKH